MLPPAAASLGRPRSTDLRRAVDAILYIASTGCQWRALPEAFPPYTTVQGYFPDWSRRGLLASLNHRLVMQAREAADREASPSAGVIGSQTGKTTACGGPCGYDARKKITWRKRHIVADTQGNLVGIVVHGADIQDHDGAPLVLGAIRSLYPWLRHIFADGVYAGEKLETALATSGVTGPSRSSSDPTRRRGSSSCRGAGWSSGPSPGSADAGDQPRTSSAPSKAP